jgi:N-methylhydantoinase B/oxoprolinase/acetone carboxylase alpha subunit
MTNTMNTPVEALEIAYPFRLVEYAVRRGSGGGAAPGGSPEETTARLAATCSGAPARGGRWSCPRKER